MIGNSFNNSIGLQFQQFGTPKSVPASEVYISEGKMFRKIFYIKKGILRSYFITHSGEEKTIFFRWEGQASAIPESIFDNKPSKQYWQALEDCEILEIDFEFLEKVSENNVILLKRRLTFIQGMLLEAMQRVESFVLEKPEQRYLKLIAQKPEVIQRVADKHIASYIGVTPVSLSRIRKRLASQKK